MTTKEGNKVIAEFRGGYQREIGDSLVWDTDFVSELSGGTPDNFLKYHTSWDWIMSVVEKIENEDYEVNICHDQCSIYCPKREIHFWAQEKTKIQSTWLSVVNFLNWYQQKKV